MQMFDVVVAEYDSFMKRHRLMLACSLILHYTLVIDLGEIIVQGRLQAQE